MPSGRIQSQAMEIALRVYFAPSNPKRPNHSASFFQKKSQRAAPAVDVNSPHHGGSFYIFSRASSSAVVISPFAFLVEIILLADHLLRIADARANAKGGTP